MRSPASKAGYNQLEFGGVRRIAPSHYTMERDTQVNRIPVVLRINIYALNTPSSQSSSNLCSLARGNLAPVIVTSFGTTQAPLGKATRECNLSTNPAYKTDYYMVGGRYRSVQFISGALIVFLMQASKGKRVGRVARLRLF